MSSTGSGAGSGISAAAVLVLCGFHAAIGVNSPICVGLPIAMPMAITPVSLESPMESGVEVRTIFMRVSDELRGLVSGDGGRPWMGTWNAVTLLAFRELLRARERSSLETRLSRACLSKRLWVSVRSAVKLPLRRLGPAAADTVAALDSVVGMAEDRFAHSLTRSRSCGGEG